MTGENQQIKQEIIDLLSIPRAGFEIPDDLRQTLHITVMDKEVYSAGYDILRPKFTRKAFYRALFWIPLAYQRSV